MCGNGDPLLIINADDLGGSLEASTAIERCFDAGAITSSTLMVHMADSERAAKLARDKSWPIGLHLNLTQAFDDPEVTPHKRERHDRVVTYFGKGLRRRRLWTEWRLKMRQLVAEEMAAQLDEFERIVGAPPTHIDSHHHVHTATVVLESLGRDLPVRRTASRRGRAIARKFNSTNYFMSFANLDVADLERAAGRAETKSVELMVHPSFAEELPVLLSEEWISAVAAADTGSFADLV